jgi:hypothetical protein
MKMNYETVKMLTALSIVLGTSMWFSHDDSRIPGRDIASSKEIETTKEKAESQGQVICEMKNEISSLKKELKELTADHKKVLDIIAPLKRVAKNVGRGFNFLPDNDEAPARSFPGYFGGGRYFPHYLNPYSSFSSSPYSSFMGGYQNSMGASSPYMGSSFNLFDPTLPFNTYPVQTMNSASINFQKGFAF